MVNIKKKICVYCFAIKKNHNYGKQKNNISKVSYSIYTNKEIVGKYNLVKFYKLYIYMFNLELLSLELIENMYFGLESVSTNVGIF
jgi:hypothetical protein